MQNTGMAPKPTTHSPIAAIVPPVLVCSASSAAMQTAASTSAPRNPARGRRSMTSPASQSPTTPVAPNRNSTAPIALSATPARISTDET